MLAHMIRQRLERAGDTSPGAFNLAADIVELCKTEAETYLTCPGLATRIPDACLSPTVEALRSLASVADTIYPWPIVPGS